MSDMVPCAHCGQLTPAPAASKPDAKVFCCTGCSAAYALISGCGLGDYYRLRQGTLAPPGDVQGAAVFTGEAFDAAHVRHRADGLAEIAWYVHGIHCTACLWLLEQLPVLDAGVRQARLAFSEARLAVIYDPKQTSPRQQAETLLRLGYPVRPFADDDAQVRADLRSMLLRLAVAGASALGSMHLSVNLYAGELTRDLDAAGSRWFALSALLVAAPALLWSALPLYRAGWAALRLRRATVDLTATIVIAIGVVASVVNYLVGSRETYVDALAMFVALLLSGRFAVATARRRARLRMASLDGVLPALAQRVTGDDVQQIPSATLRPGDVVRVRRGEVLPCDGTAQTSMLLDVAVLNGESRPQTISTGAAVYAGTTCLSNEAQLVVTATGVGTRIGGLIRDANRAGDRPGRLVLDVDRWQGPFLAAIALTALATWAGWAWFGHSTFGLTQAVAVILVSCPCALGLATPLVLAMATGRAAARGIVLRDPTSLDVLGHPSAIRHLVLDKTGTITEGRMRVIKWNWELGVLESEQKSIQDLVASAEARVAHPVALALCADHAGESDIESVEEIPGQGIIAQTKSGELRIGNARLTGMTLTGKMQADDAVGLVGVTLAGKPRATVACADPVRAGVGDFITDMQRQGVTVHIASGDDPTVAKAIGEKVGVADELVRGGLLPEDKAALIRELKQDGAVVVIGDGINDAAALGTADVGIGLRGGIEAAASTCRIVMVRHDAITAILELFTSARSARHRVGLILLISFAYNIVGVVLAAAGIWGPLVCAIAMPISSLTAVLLAAQGRYFTAGSHAPLSHRN